MEYDELGLPEIRLPPLPSNFESPLIINENIYQNLELNQKENYIKIKKD